MAPTPGNSALKHSDELQSVLQNLLHPEKNSGYESDESARTDVESLDSEDMGTQSLTIKDVWTKLREQITAVETRKYYRSHKKKARDRHDENIDQVNEVACDLDGIKILQTYLDSIQKGSSGPIKNVREQALNSEWQATKRNLAESFYDDIKTQLQGFKLDKKTEKENKVLGITAQVKNSKAQLEREIETRLQKFSELNKATEEYVSEYERMIASGTGLGLCNNGKSSSNHEDGYIITHLENQKYHNDSPQDQIVIVSSDAEETKPQNSSDYEEQRRLFARLDYRDGKSDFMLGALSVPQPGQSTYCMPFFDPKEQDMKVVLEDRGLGDPQVTKVYPWKGFALDEILSRKNNAIEKSMNDGNGGVQGVYHGIIHGDINTGKVNGDFKLDNVLYNPAVKKFSVIDNEYVKMETPSTLSTGLLDTGMHQVHIAQYGMSLDFVKKNAASADSIPYDQAVLGTVQDVVNDKEKENLFNEGMMLQSVFYDEKQTQHDVFAMASFGVNLALKSMGNPGEKKSLKSWCQGQQKAMIESLCKKVETVETNRGEKKSKLNLEQKREVLKALLYRKDESGEDIKPDVKKELAKYLEKEESDYDRMLMLWKSRSKAPESGRGAFENFTRRVVHSVKTFFQGVTKSLSAIGHFFSRNSTNTTENIASDKQTAAGTHKDEESSLSDKAKAMLDEVNNYIDEIKEKKTALQAMNQEFTVEKFRKDYGTWLPTATLAAKIDNIFKSEAGLQISPNTHQNHAGQYSDNISQEREEIQIRFKEIKRNTVERGEDPLTKDKSKGPE